MSSSRKLISMLFLFAFFAMQIHAREFFSKIPRVSTNEKETTKTTREQEEQEPRFVPETQNGYGLYGHETGAGEPSFTTKETYEPYVTPVKYHPDEPYNSIPETGSNNKKTYYYNKNAYESTEKQNLGEASFTEKRWSTKKNQNNNYNSNNGERQGISDTRYFENGKYYYDIKSENYYPNQFQNSRVVASRNEFNENRYNNMGRYNQNQEDFEDTEEEFDP
ncbi:protein E6-like isoform X3 [Hibiscus syriacus]|uniref:protein E6-like isoform X2 n=1 Tax=Hibiscus syriacus TaxID=106335 RepID=UPI0019239C1E|nr:protein E6-like isoform X2 [Hibiscus syriacus]XP_039052949.1 protein E6-like isoform X3 [Hibiscus syriacus]